MQGHAKLGYQAKFNMVIPSCQIGQQCISYYFQTSLSHYKNYYHTLQNTSHGWYQWKIITIIDTFNTAQYYNISVCLIIAGTCKPLLRQSTFPQWNLDNSKSTSFIFTIGSSLKKDQSTQNPSPWRLDHFLIKHVLNV